MRFVVVAFAAVLLGAAAPLPPAPTYGPLAPAIAQTSNTPEAPEACPGTFPGGCCSGHGNMARPHVADKKGYVHCNGDDDYPKADSCRCER